MEVKNPLFLDDPTPATPANLTQHQTQPSNQGPNSPAPLANEKKNVGNEKKAKK